VILLHWRACDQPGNSCGRNSCTVSTSVIKFRGQDIYTRNRKWITEGITSYDYSISSEWKYNTPSNIFGNFTFVSPSVYMAHHPISVDYSDIIVSCNTATCTIEPGQANLVKLTGVIIPVPSTNAYTIQSHIDTTVDGKRATGCDYVHMIASGLVTAQNLATKYKVDRLNFQHLADPVPASAYFDSRDDCWGKQTHFRTITDGSYRPMISLDDDVWRS
jgi:hypothetical protein